MSGLLAVVQFLLSTVFSFVLFVLWARLALRYWHVSALHPASQMTSALTDPVLLPIERLSHITYQPNQAIDKIALLAIIVVTAIKSWIMGWLIFGISIPVPYLLLAVFGNLITQPCQILFYMILIQVILSWVNPTASHPFLSILRLITHPVLKLAHRYIPPIAQIDFSPMIVLIGLQAIIILIHTALPISQL